MFGADDTSKVRFKMFCRTCNEDLEYSPEGRGDCDPFKKVEGAQDAAGRGIFEVDLSSNACGCDQWDEDVVPEWVFEPAQEM